MYTHIIVRFSSQSARKFGSSPVQAQNLNAQEVEPAVHVAGTCLVVNFALWTRVFRSTVHMTWICITRRRLAKLYIREVDWWDRTIHVLGSHGDENVNQTKPKPPCVPTCESYTHMPGQQHRWLVRGGLDDGWFQHRAL